MLLEEDRKALLSLLNNVTNSSNEIYKQVTSLLQRFRDGSIETSKGISFLEVKNHQLLSYLINVVYVMCRKTKGLSLNGDAAIDRLVELRTVLERMRPIEHKLRYQIEKVMKVAVANTTGDHDPLQYKPNPEDLVSKLDDEEEEQEKVSEDEEDLDKDTSKVYKPPKLASAYYDDNVTLEEKAKKTSQKRALSKSIMEELRKEYHEGPEEVYDTFDQHRAKEDKLEKETTEYEEKYFVRMPVSKKQKHAAQKVRTLASLDDLVSFGGSREDHNTARKTSKQKHGKKHSKKGGQKKRRKFH